MTRSLVLLLALCSLVGCASPSRAPVDVVVLSYNIHHGRGEDGQIDLQRLARVIRESGADLVALQEVDVGTGRAGGVDQAAELARLSGLHGVFGEAMPYDGGSYGEAVLSRWPPLAHDVIALPASDGHEPRAALAVHVQPPGCASALRFVATHFDHTADDHDRVLQARTILEGLSSSPEPTLLVGDLNAEPRSAPMVLLWENGWMPADASLSPTWPAEQPERKIDWILAVPRGDGSRSGLARAEVLDERMASDHRPLRAVWRPHP
jgi:endonuclease/exonuclease/phosphatase family metal-dependent hydrolase